LAHIGLWDVHVRNLFRIVHASISHGGSSPERPARKRGTMVPWAGGHSPLGYRPSAPQREAVPPVTE
jgi:hypothetical protein